MVAVVGNANSIFDKPTGELIDQHDCIIRFNWGGIIEPKSQGSRTSIVITANKHFDKTRNVYPFSTIWATGQTPYDVQSKYYIKECDYTSNGFRVLYWLDKTKTPNVSIFGMDWKTTPTFYKEPKRVTERHNYEKEREICQAWIKKNGWIIH